MQSRCLVAVPAIVVFLSGCGGDDGTSTTTAAPSPPPAPSPDGLCHTDTKMTLAGDAFACLSTSMPVDDKCCTEFGKQMPQELKMDDIMQNITPAPANNTAICEACAATDVVANSPQCQGENPGTKEHPAKKLTLFFAQLTNSSLDIADAGDCEATCVKAFESEEVSKQMQGAKMSVKIPNLEDACCEGMDPLIDWLASVDPSGATPPMPPPDVITSLCTGCKGSTNQIVQMAVAAGCHAAVTV